MSDYIKIGDVGVVARDQIVLVRRNGEFIEVAFKLADPATFWLKSVDAAQKVLADVLRQLCRDNSDYRFFKSIGCYRYYAVPASGEQTGRSFFPSSDGSCSIGAGNWSLEEMSQEPADGEITQSEFETAVGSGWRNKL